MLSLAVGLEEHLVLGWACLEGQLLAPMLELQVWWSRVRQVLPERPPFPGPRAGKARCTWGFPPRYVLGWPSRGLCSPVLSAWQ